MCDKEHFSALEHRVDDLEARVNTMHDEMRGGFAAINANIETLSQQITNMDKRIIEEKVKWGDTLRSIVAWTMRTVLLGCAAAMGMTAYKMIFG